MNELRAPWVLLVAAIALAIVAIVAGTNEVTAIPAAFGAAILVGLFAVLSLVPAGRILRLAPPEFSSDSLVALRSAFREGAIGRERLVEAVSELEREAFGRGAVRESAVVAGSPGRLSAEEFRAWVAERVDRLERLT